MPEQILPAYEVSERYPWAGLRLRTALLNGESLSLGAGWSLTL